MRAHDEWNIEVPEEMAEEMTKVLKDCMKKAGAFFCRKVELPAEGEALDYWVHCYGNLENCTSNSDIIVSYRWSLFDN